LTNAAGCGSGLKEYPLILKGSAEESAAKSFAGKVVDFNEFLDQLGMVTPPRTKGVPRVVYQDACHLRHAQGVAEAPRRLLRAIPGVELLEAEESDICCGSAGSYNIDQPKIARALGKRKVSDLMKTKPDWIASGNIGCIMQVRSWMNSFDQAPQVIHLAGLLRRAYEEEL
jgi:glycolate oxidase iron-sulfur subunit